MFNFFTTLYFSLFEGSWQAWLIQDVSVARNGLSKAIKNVVSFILNALGGNFEALQTFNIFEGFNQRIVGAGNEGYFLVSLILALITFVGVAFVTWKIIKGVLSIFFEGWR